MAYRFSQRLVQVRSCTWQAAQHEAERLSADGPNYVFDKDYYVVDEGPDSSATGLWKGEWDPERRLPMKTK
jgi:hypothetical protein